MRTRALIAPVGSGLLGAVLFLPALSSGRLADDFVLLRTVRVRRVVSSFPHNDLGQPAGARHFYRPVWVLWNAAIYQLPHDPAVTHPANVLLFAVLTPEVVVLVRLLAGPRAGLIAGLLFAVLPVHGESVAWISGDTDLLAATLGLGPMLAALVIRVSARATRPSPR